MIPYHRCQRGSVPTAITCSGLRNCCGGMGRTCSASSVGRCLKKRRQNKDPDFSGFGYAAFFRLAHLAFIAALIRARAAADIFRLPLPGGRPTRFLVCVPSSARIAASSFPRWLLSSSRIVSRFMTGTCYQNGTEPHLACFGYSKTAFFG